MNLLSVGYDDSAALLPWVISTQGKASTSALWSQRQRELLMRKHKLTGEWDGNEFEIRGIFNQPRESYGARNGFINWYCAVRVYSNVERMNNSTSRIQIKSNNDSHVVSSYVWRRRALFQARLGGEVNDPHDQFSHFIFTSPAPYLMQKVLLQQLHYMLINST